jgi:alcohol dehydrogenase class IV
MNAVCLPHALRFNREVAEAELARLGEAMGVADPIARVEELSGLVGPTRLREYDVPRDELSELAEATAQRPAAQGNPRPASPADILGLFEAAW